MSRKAPYVRWDREGDALFVRLRDGEIARTREAEHGRNIDFDADGEVMAVEVLDVSAGFALDDLAEQYDFQDELRRVESDLPRQHYQHYA